MTIEAWCTVRTKHARAAFDGEGARRFGGRWNSPGTAVVYTAGSTSLAVLELLVHLDAVDALKGYCLFRAAFDETLVERIESHALPRGWADAVPRTEVRAFGDQWVEEGRSAVLRVPSAVVPHEWNYLLNPRHDNFRDITISKRQRLVLDPRLIQRES